jgi:hypothetical protein
MVPLEGYDPLSSDEWEKMSSEKTRRGGGPKKGKVYFVEDGLIESVLGNNQSFELKYTTAEEADKMRVRLNARGEGRIRVLTNKDKPNSVFIGPIDPES